MSDIKKRIAERLCEISPNIYYRCAYFHNRKRFPNLKNPKDISEYLISKLLSGDIDNLYELADKFKVRDYVKERGHRDILIPLIGKWDSFEQINFNSLPNQFVLKMNFGAGMNFICFDKGNINLKALNETIDNWIEAPKNIFEPHYNLIERKILCEKLITDNADELPTDYKFMCVNGKVKCILACANRNSKNEAFQTYSIDWQYLANYSRRKEEYIEIEKPTNLNEMIHIAECLAFNMDFVRVDLYDVQGQIYFGELTLTPAGCILHGWSDFALKEIGKELYKEF